MSGYDDPNPTDDTLPPREWQAQPTPREPQVGDVLGRYRLDALLGRGAMGIVFRAHAEHLGRDVALKVISGAYAGLREARTRLEREARAAGRTADHPGIAGVHDLGLVGDLPYLVMELVEGPTLNACVEAERFGDRELVALLAQAARAVHHAHTCGVLHRDVKPGNLLIAQDGTVRVTDFGLASFSLTGMQMTRLTRDGAAVGTPAFMSPEQAVGKACDARSDVYGLGATLYHCLCGTAPVPHGAVDDMVERVVAGRLIAPLAARPDLPPALAAVLDRALATEPDHRYPSALALAEELERWLAGDAVEPPVARSGRRPVRAPATRAIAAAAVVGALLLGGAAWWWLAGRDGPDGATAAEIRTASRAREAAETFAGRTEDFAALSRRTAEPLGVLEDHFHGAPVDGGQLDAALAAVVAAADDVGGRLAAPWRAFAFWLAERGAGSLGELEQSVAAAGDDPLPGMLLVRARALQYLQRLPTPQFSVNPGSVQVRPADDTPAADAARAALSQAAERWRGDLASRRLVRAEAMQAFAGGAHALARGDHGTLIGLLEPLADDPFVGRESSLLRGYSLHLVGRFADAGTVLHPLAERGWETARHLAAASWLFDGVTRRHAGQDPEPSLRRATQLLTVWIERDPDVALPLLLRGQAAEIRAALLSARDEDAGAELRGAIRDYDAALPLLHETAAAYLSLARACITLGRWTKVRLRDRPSAIPCFERAIAACEAVEQQGRPPAQWQLPLADATLNLGVALHELRHNARPVVARARDLYAAEAAARPTAEVLTNAGRATGYLVRQDVIDQRPTLDNIKAAAAWFDRAVLHDPAYAEAWSLLGIAMNQLGLELRRQRLPRESIAAYRRAIEAHAEVAERFPERRAAELWLSGGCHFNIALALDVLGEDGRATCADGLKLTTESLTLNADDPMAWKSHATGHHVIALHEHKRGDPDVARGHFAEAAKCYEQVGTLQPAMRPQTATALAECRAGAGAPAGGR